MTDKPHLTLTWHFDCNTQELSCTLADGEVKYIAHEGGSNGYTKTYKNKETFVSAAEWETKEKFWISEHYGEQYGYFQPDHSREAIEPKTGLLEGRQMGFGPFGEYLDHMQRSQRVLDGGDMSLIRDSENHDLANSNISHLPLFYTPDCGLTIYKLMPTDDTYYNGNYNRDAKDGVWTMISQPCMMQPRSKGYILSNYEEMELCGYSSKVIDQCKAGKWLEPAYPELQKLFSYPTVNTLPLSKDNIKKIY